jgi:predicted PurR-regulated permease PerM
MHIDDLQHHSPTKPKNTLQKLRKEVRVFVIFFVVVTVVMIVFTNINLFIASFNNLFDASVPKVQNITKTDSSENNDIATIIDKSDATTDEINALLEKYQS